MLQAQRLCCSIFLTLMGTFRKSLKAEIGVFFPMIMLRPIEPAAGGSMPNAPGGRVLGSWLAEHCIMALESGEQG